MFILGRNAEKSAGVVAAFADEGLTIEAITCDVLDEGAVAGAVKEVLEKAGVELGKTYPKPVVDHKEARALALAGYKQSRS